jgi:hypothetical protein
MIFVVDSLNHCVDTVNTMTEARSLYAGYNDYSFIITKSDDECPLPWTYPNGLPAEKAKAITAWGNF